MAKQTASITAAALGKRILQQLKDLLAGEWASVNATDRRLLAAVAKGAAAVAVRKLKGEDTADDERQIAAQLANLADATAERVRRDFWKAADIVIGGAAAFAKVAL